MDVLRSTRTRVEHGIEACETVSTVPLVVLVGVLDPSVYLIRIACLSIFGGPLRCRVLPPPRGAFGAHVRQRAP
eukprot:6296007-Prymnesium_polylepis.2